MPADAIIFNARRRCRSPWSRTACAHLRKITVARDLGTEVEVRDGVKPGDQVILNPSVDLVDGAKVQVAANPSGSAAAAGPYGTK